MTRGNRRKRGGRRFIQLYTNVKRSEAYHSLDSYARSALIELLDKYTGCNNGMIVMSCHELERRLDCAPGTAMKALRALDDAGLVRPMEVGVWRGRRGTTWRLTFYRCDKTGDLPISHWPERISSSRGDTQKARCVHVVTHKAGVSSRGDTQKPNSSMNENGVSSRGEPHIDIYHRGTGNAVPPETQCKARARIRASASLRAEVPKVTRDEEGET